MRHGRFARLLAPVVLMASAAEAQVVTQLESEGNLAPNVPVGCVALEAVPAGANPVDLYAGTLACVRAGEFVRARELMLLGDVRGRFDGGRVNDTTARAAWIVAKQNVQGQFRAKERAGLEAAFRELSDDAARCALGSRILARGAPDYVPTYMIRHGMGAFMGGGADAVTPYADPAASYAKVAGAYLKCPLDATAIGDAAGGK